MSRCTIISNVYLNNQKVLPNNIYIPYLVLKQIQIKRCKHRSRDQQDIKVSNDKQTVEIIKIHSVFKTTESEDLKLRRTLQQMQVFT